MSMLLRLWQAQRPRAVVVGWGTRRFLHLPQRALRDLPVRDASSTPRSSSSSRCCRRSFPATGIVCGKQDGFEAHDFLAAAVAGERARGGTTLVATSDRDAYQLAAPDVTILQPVTA